MKRMLSLLALAAPALPVYGYIRSVFTYGDGSTAYMKRSDAANIQFYVNTSVVPGLQSSLAGSAVTVISANSNPMAAIQAAAATWNATGTSIVRFMPLKTTTKLIDSTDGQDTVAVASTAGDLSVLGFKAGTTMGAVAVTVAAAAGFAQGSMPTGDVTDTDIVINPAFAFSTDGSTMVDLQAVMTHEFGHSLGLNHSGLLGATMFQFAEITERYLSTDELGFAAAVYPASGASLGTLGGKVSASDGSAVQNALVELIDTANGNSLTALTGSDGSYSVQAPAGSYAVYAEPLTGIVTSAYLYLPATAAVTTNFQATVLGGAASPTLVSVTNGATAAAPVLTVAEGVTTLTPPFVGTGKAGGSGDIGISTNQLLSQTPVILPSGQSVDIGLLGTGIDATATLTVIGQGISVHPGSVHVDTGINFGAGQVLVRATLDVAAHSKQTLATLIVTKGSNVLTMSGQLVVVPPTPTIANVQDAESARTTIVPGEWLAIYGTNLANSLSIWGASDFINGNVLPTSIAGVRVQFNGSPGAVYVASPTQINVQAPSGLSGKVNVVVTNNGSPSGTFNVNAVSNSPSFFIYPAGGKLYPAAVHLSGALVGDPAVQPGAVKAKPGETILFFVNGLDSSASGTIIGTPVTYSNQVTVNVGSASTTAAFAGLVAAGEYQLNVVIPAGLANGDYPISVTAGGQTSPSGVTLSVSN